MATNKERPIIIVKRKVNGGGGHHGGAWKVAYADFVTAMMAFFLVMWLVNSITKEQRAALFEYFKNPAMEEGRSVNAAPGQAGPGPPPCPVTASRIGARVPVYGALAQLGERQLCKLEVAGSIPARSTRKPAGNGGFFVSPA